MRRTEKEGRRTGRKEEGRIGRRKSTAGSGKLPFYFSQIPSRSSIRSLRKTYKRHGGHFSDKHDYWERSENSVTRGDYLIEYRR
jgi:hypothetical protein